MTEPLGSASPGDIAIIGMSGRFPGARNLEEFWNNLRDGAESISFFSEPEPAALNMLAGGQSADWVGAAGVLADIELFDACFFGLTCREAETLDPQQRLLLECAWHALEDAGYDPESRQSIAVYAGGVLSTYLFNILSSPGHRALVGDFLTFTGNDKDHLATRVSYKLNLKGPSLTVQTACSTSLVAVATACQSLLDQQCDMALAGGVAVRVPQRGGYVYQEGMIFSRDGHCRPFDAEASGTLFSNGVGLVVLKRLADALSDGDSIRAIIKGSAINNDGSLKVGYTAPSLDAQAEAIATAQAMAGIDPETISYVEAHGTATQLGDPIEVAALTKAFQAGTSKRNFCALGSVKSNVGHLDAAAGIAGLIKTVLALEHGLIPPSINFSRPNPLIDFAQSPFYVNTRLSVWDSTGAPRRAGVSSFGIGGTNAHVVLEQAPALDPSETQRRCHLLTVSARSEAALDNATRNLGGHLRAHPELALADVAYTCQIGRRAFDHRRIVACTNLEDAARALESRDPARVLSGSRPAQAPGFAFIFPGQGTQRVGMAQELYQAEPAFRAEVDRCCALLEPHLGLDLRTILYPASTEPGESERQLDRTAMTQPALFVVEYALAALWMEWGIRPVAMIGHSIGEYVAATLAGVFSLEDALFVVAERGRLTQSLPGGAMLAVPLAAGDVAPFLSADLQLAAINEPASCTVSGPTAAIADIESRLAAAGIASQRLRTSHAFHSRMMEPILEPFATTLRRIRLNSPQIPYVSNLTGTWTTASAATDPAYWVAHLRQPVRFADGISTLLGAPNCVLLEVGPGHTLASLAARHPTKPGHIILSSLGRTGGESSESAGLTDTLGRLWLAGVEIDWAGYWRHERRLRVPLPAYPFERRRHWVDPQPEPNTAAAQLLKNPDMTEWFWTPCWKQAPPLLLMRQRQAESQRRWLMFLDDCGLGAGFASRLEQEGQTVVTVRAGNRFARVGELAYEIGPGLSKHYQALFKELRARDDLYPERVGHFWSVTRDGGSPVDLLDSHQTLGFYSLVFLAQALGDHSRGEPVDLNVISSGTQAVTGRERLSPQKATLLGPCRVIPQEYPTLSCRNIDVDAADLDEGSRVIDDLMAELSVTAAGTVVALRGHRRWVQTFEKLPINEPDRAKIPLQDGGVYLITGGLGGIGLALAKYLAAAVRARLVLVGRSAFPDGSQHRQYLASHDANDRISLRIRGVQTLEELGAEVLVLRADVTDYRQMQDAITTARAHFGTIHGVIHAAGVAGGGTIQLKTPESAAKVLAPKVLGTLLLDSLFEGSRPGFFVLCSSLSAMLGGAGQADYCGANAFLDAFAQWKFCQGDRSVVSINWDTWQEVGMAVEALPPAGAFAAGPDALQSRITPIEGQQAFARLLSVELPQVAVATRHLPALCESQRAAARTPAMIPPAAPTPAAPQYESEGEDGYVAPSDEVERTIAELWQSLLGVKRVSVYDSFFELGGHSLLGTQLVGMLRSAFKVELPLRSLFEVPTVAGMAERIKAVAWATAGSEHLNDADP